MKPTYTEIHNEYQKVLEESSCENTEDSIVNLISSLINNDILKDQLFLITLYDKNKPYDINDCIQKACKPDDIINVLNTYKNDNMKFLFTLFENN